jgi:hypothetical protein
MMSRIHTFLSELEWFSCCHIYRELNSTTNKLSKESLMLVDGALFFRNSMKDNLEGICLFFSSSKPN